MNDLPEFLKKAGYEFYIDSEKLWDLDVPEEEMNISELLWHFEIPIWGTDGEDWNLTPQDVIDGKEGIGYHKQKVEEADLDYAILVIKNKDKWVILDGVHRLVKAYQLGKKTIKVKKVKSKDIE